MCSGTGHFSRNCPQRNKVASSSKGDAPPGVMSYSVKVDFGDIESQQGLSKATASRVHANLMDLFDLDDEGGNMISLPELVSNEYSLTETDTIPAMPVNASKDEESLGTAESEVSEWYPYKYLFCKLPTDFGEPLSEQAQGWLTAMCYPGGDPVISILFPVTTPV